MSDQGPPGYSDPRWLPLVLSILAGLVAFISLASGAVFGYQALVEHEASLADLLSMLARLAWGLGLSGVLLGLAALIRRGRGSWPALPASEHSPLIEEGDGEASGDLPSVVPVQKASADGEADPSVTDEMLYLLREVADNSLLTDDEKRAKLERRRARERRSAISHVEELINQSDYRGAREACQKLLDSVGRDAEFEQLAQRVEQARAASEAKDLAEARRKVSDLMSISAWDRAAKVVAELRANHPDSEKVVELSKWIEHERQTFETQQRRRMYAEIDRHTSRRQWREALNAAQLLIDRYGDSPEAEAIRPKLDTLSANAEIQERQALESQIKDLIKKHRFAEAVDLARNVIQTYPHSPQADVLRSQLPRLEKKAAKG